MGNLDHLMQPNIRTTENVLQKLEFMYVNCLISQYNKINVLKFSPKF